MRTSDSQFIIHEMKKNWKGIHRPTFRAMLDTQKTKFSWDDSFLVLEWVQDLSGDAWVSLLSHDLLNLTKFYWKHRFACGRGADCSTASLMFSVTGNRWCDTNCILQYVFLTYVLSKKLACGVFQIYFLHNDGAIEAVDATLLEGKLKLCCKSYLLHLMFDLKKQLAHRDDTFNWVRVIRQSRVTLEMHLSVRHKFDFMWSFLFRG